MKPYPIGHYSTLPKSLNRRGNTKEHVVRFLNSMGAHAHYTDLCVKKVPKSLMDQAYTSYIDLKPGSLNYGSTLYCCSTPDVFCAEEKFTSGELGRKHQSPREDLDAYF